MRVLDLESLQERVTQRATAAFPKISLVHGRDNNSYGAVLDSSHSTLIASILGGAIASVTSASGTALKHYRSFYVKPMNVPRAIRSL